MLLTAKKPAAAKAWDGSGGDKEFLVFEQTKVGGVGGEGGGEGEVEEGREGRECALSLAGQGRGFFKLNANGWLLGLFLRPDSGIFADKTQMEGAVWGRHVAPPATALHSCRWVSRL